jgi:heme/copper-type cytochrome/quinol oxidase subunit 1
MATHAAFMPGARAQSRAWAWLTTVDHKRIGILSGTTAFAVLLLGGGESLLHASWLFGAALDTGWFGYANLTSTRFSPGANLDFWIFAIQILGISSILGALNFVVTIVNMRAPRMTLMRMPVFVWMILTRGSCSRT